MELVRNFGPPNKLHPWPSGPWERIHIDFAGPCKGSMLFVVVDAYSKCLRSPLQAKHWKSHGNYLQGMACHRCWCLIMAPSLQPVSLLNVCEAIVSTTSGVLPIIRVLMVRLSVLCEPLSRHYTRERMTGMTEASTVCTGESCHTTCHNRSVSSRIVHEEALTYLVGFTATLSQGTC